MKHENIGHQNQNQKCFHSFSQFCLQMFSLQLIRIIEESTEVIVNVLRQSNDTLQNRKIKAKNKDVTQLQ